MRAHLCCSTSSRPQEQTPNRPQNLYPGLQAYISQLKLEGLALTSDMVYVTQSGEGTPGQGAAVGRKPRDVLWRWRAQAGHAACWASSRAAAVQPHLQSLASPR